MHFYVYTFHNNCYVYERTCGTKKSAKDRVDELKARGKEALYLINHTIRGAFY